MSSFEDHFSKQAGQYARYRPTYPGELYRYLAACAPGRQLAWDCGTGNGQAALGLAEHFEHVVATDASSHQLDQAEPHARVEYRVERAEDVSLDRNCVDLISVAVAVHWFDLDNFYQAVRRVGKTNGILAVWTYHLPEIGNDIDQILSDYYHNVISGYWPKKFHYVDERYRTLPFPFDELKTPEFEMQADWDRHQFVGFLDSWSASRRYREERGEHPVELIWNELVEAWEDPDQLRHICWPIHLRVGRIQ